MLEINLIPVRQLKKRAKARRELALIGLVQVAACLLCFTIAVWQGGVIYSLEKKKQRLEHERKKLEPFLVEMKKLEKKKVELQRKASIIDKLRQDSPLTVRILDEVANRLDNQRMWLTSLEQQGENLTLAGVALDNHTIAQFMDNLTASKFVVDVALGDSSLEVVSGRNLKRFTLNCTIAHPGKGEEKEKPKGEKS